MNMGDDKMRVKVITVCENKRKNLVHAKVLEKGELENLEFPMWLGKPNENWEGHPVHEGDILEASYKKKDELDEECLVYNDVEYSIFKHVQNLGKAKGYNLTEEDISTEICDGLNEKIKEYLCEVTNGHLDLDQPYVLYEVGDKILAGHKTYQLIYIKELQRYGLLDRDTASVDHMSGCESEHISDFMVGVREHFKSQNLEIEKVEE